MCGFVCMYVHVYEHERCVCVYVYINCISYVSTFDLHVIIAFMYMYL